MKLRRMAIALTFVLWLLSGSLFAGCPDWYLSTLECVEYRKILAADSSNDVCGKILREIDLESKNLDSWVKFSSCLKEVAPPAKADKYINEAKKKFPRDEDWVYQTLKNYRLHQEIQSAAKFAYLAENLFSESKLIRGEIGEAYLQNSDYVSAARSFISEIKNNDIRQFTLQFKFKSLFKAASISYTASELMDSILVPLNTLDENQLSFLSNVSWEQNYPKGSLVCLLRLSELKLLDWEQTKMWIEKFSSLNFFPEARTLLFSYKEISNSRVEAEVFGFQIKLAYELRDWNAFFSFKKELEEIARQPEDIQYSLSYGMLMASMGADDKRLREISADIAQNLMAKPNIYWKQKAFFVLIQIDLARGHLKQAREKLLAEKANDTRQSGSGEILHWLAMVDLFELKFKSADSLFVLASAYTGEDFTEKSLEYRHYFILDSSNSNLTLMVKGLDEYPSSQKEKIAALQKIPEGSGLWAHAQLKLAQIFENSGEQDSSLAVLNRLSQNGQGSWLADLAKTKLNFLKEPKYSAKKSLEAYDEILLKYQRGLLSEFSRERVKKLKSGSK